MSKRKKKHTPPVYQPDSEEAQVIELLNAYRKSLHLRQLAANAKLGQLAGLRAANMAAIGIPSHLDDRRMEELIEKYGYGEKTGFLWRECIFVGNVGYGDAESAIEALKTSPSHDAAMRFRKLQDVGVGRVVAADGRTFYCIVLGAKL